jgi:hypothetical protein
MFSLLKGHAADATDALQPWTLIVQPCGEDDEVFSAFPFYWSTGGMKLTGEKPRCSEKPLSQCHFVHHNSHMDRPGIDPRPPRWEAGDCLSHGTAELNGLARYLEGRRVMNTSWYAILHIATCAHDIISSAPNNRTSLASISLYLSQFRRLPPFCTDKHKRNWIPYCLPIS